MPADKVAASLVLIETVSEASQPKQSIEALHAHEGAVTQTHCNGLVFAGPFNRKMPAKAGLDGRCVEVVCLFDGAHGLLGTPRGGAVGGSVHRQAFF